MSLRLPAYEVRAVDSTGCGDAFTAGFLLAWRETGRVAGAAGALVATGLGSDAGIIDFAATEAAMRSRTERAMREAG